MILYYILLFILIIFDIYTFNKNKGKYKKREMITYIFLTIIAIILSMVYFVDGSFRISECLIKHLN